MSERQVNPQAALLQLIGGAWVTQAISTAARLGFADHLAAGPLQVEELATRVGTDTKSTARLLRALAMFGIFSEDSPGRFALTPMAEQLRSDRPGSLHNWAVMQGERWHWQAWGALTENVRTGVTAFDSTSGRPLFQFLAQDSEASRLFNSAMAETSSLSIKAIVKSYDFSAFQRVTDVGGGEGVLLQHLLEVYPALRGVLFDREPAVEAARQRLRGSPLESRLEYQSGNFFETVPAGADAYLLKHILHDWNDESAGKLLRTCRAQMAPHARLLIIEYVLPVGNTFSHGKMLDLEMLVMCGGQERTQAELEALLKASGLSLGRVIPTPSGLSIIEGVPA